MNTGYVSRKMLFPIITEEALKLPIYVKGVGSLEYQHPCFRPNGLPLYHFLYSTAGKGYLKIENTEYTITSNMGFYFEPGVIHEYYALEEPWTTYWVIFDGYAARDFGVVAELGRSLVFHVHDADRLNMLYEDIYTASAKTGLTATADSSIHLYRFLLSLNSCIGTEAPNTRRFRSNQIKPVLKYIENHMEGDITLADMASLAGVSPQHLCRIFKQELNMRPFEYLTRCRLRNAKELLTGPDNLILKEIAAKVGFNDVSYFCAVFKQYEGMTPVEFKRMHRQQ